MFDISNYKFFDIVKRNSQQKVGKRPFICSNGAKLQIAD